MLPFQVDPGSFQRREMAPENTVEGETRAWTTAQNDLQPGLEGSFGYHNTRKLLALLRVHEVRPLKAREQGTKSS